MGKVRWTILAMLAVLVVAMPALGGAASAQQEGTTVFPSATAQTEGSHEQLRVEKPGSGNPGPLRPTQKLAIKQGYLVPDQGAYERAKAGAQPLAGGGGKTTYAVAQGADPETLRSWEGIRHQRGAPSDSTSAIGPTRYIELINIRYAIYDRTHNRPIGTGTLNELAGEPPPPPPGKKKGVLVFDPQIMWDPTTRRFYYAADDVYSATDNRLAFGFSKTASPSSAADFCKYVIKFGPLFPDYPKLGDTEDLLLLGVNTFLTSEPLPFLNSSLYLRSDLVSITKPPAGSGCPRTREFTVDIEKNLRDAAGGRAWTPVPANQIDPAKDGYVVAASLDVYQGEGFARSLSVYEASSAAGGSLKLGAPTTLKVPFYAIPANAPQPRSNYRIATLDARNTQAILAKDPSRGGKVALWTQHTVLGGSGAEIRWYEIDPTEPSLFQRGTISGPNGLYAFNGAISPDRQVNGGISRFGANMVVGFNTSSTEQRPDIRMVSKQGNAPVSDHVLIKSSPAVLEDKSCFKVPWCRWGDYSAATPDPVVPGAATTGRVWLTNQWVMAQGKPNKRPAKWGTWNWAVTP
jgi:hypothetical protein